MVDEFSAVNDCNWLSGSLVEGLSIFKLIQDIGAFDHGTEANVLFVQVGFRLKGNVKLGLIRVRPLIRHSHHSATFVLHCKSLIGKLKKKQLFKNRIEAKLTQRSEKLECPPSPLLPLPVSPI